MPGTGLADANIGGAMGGQSGIGIGAAIRAGGAHDAPSEG